MITVTQKGLRVDYTNHEGQSSSIRVTEDVGALFAAAPDLLEACEMCERIITEIKEVPEGWDSGANRQNLIASRHYLRAAIAKANPEGAKL